MIANWSIKVFKNWPLLVLFLLPFQRVELPFIFEVRFVYLIAILIVFFRVKKYILPTQFVYYLKMVVLHSLFFIFLGRVLWSENYSLYEDIRWQYKPIITFLKLCIFQIPFYIAAYYIIKNYKLATIIQTIYYSLLLLSIFGILQFLIYYFLGFDLFPFKDAENGEMKARQLLLGNNIIRANSFAYEPRDLSVFNALGLLMSYYFKPIAKECLFRLTQALFLVCLVLTFSTSGYTLFLLISAVFLVFKIFYTKNLSLPIIFLVALFIVYFSVSRDIIDFVFSGDKIENLINEDVDFAADKFLINNLVYFFTGVGGSGIYLHIDDIIKSTEKLSYVQGLAIQVRYGLRRLIVDYGFFITIYFYFYVYSVMTLRRINNRRSENGGRLFFLLSVLGMFTLRDNLFDYLIVFTFVLQYFPIRINTRAL